MKQKVRIAREPARSPEGPWPLLMRAPTLAALLDFEDTSSLLKAIERNEAPRPGGTRGKGRRMLPVWSLLAVQQWIVKRHPFGLEEDPTPPPAPVRRWERYGLS
jgi:hypothetical protein